MPKAGVGRKSWNSATTFFKLFQSIYAQSRRWKGFIMTAILPSGRFQSIYAQSRRWKTIRGNWSLSVLRVSIHLCPKQALEEYINLCHFVPHFCFNPFMPKAGVGRTDTLRGLLKKNPVSIHLCPKQALEVKTDNGINGRGFVSIHLCPKQALEAWFCEF